MLHAGIVVVSITLAGLPLKPLGGLNMENSVRVEAPQVVDNTPSWSSNSKDSDGIKNKQVRNRIEF